jgi:tetratricopeptide (TPR) repeat protein
MGLTAEALADLETAATLEPQNSDVHQALTELRRFDRFDPVKQLIHGCRYEEAKALLGRFPIDDRDSGEYEYLKGCCEEGCGSIETALRCYDNAISLGHETAWLFGRRAVLISRLGRVGEARAEMAKAVALSEGRADMFDFIEDVRRIVGLETARHLIAGERYADALPILKSMLPESFGSGEIHYLLACCMERTGRHDEASQHLAQAQAQGWSDLSISPRRAEPL